MKLLPKIRIYKNKSSLLSIVLNLSLLFLVLYPLLNPQKANAATSEAFVRFDRLSTGAAISGTACLKTPAGEGTETNVVIVFPTGWTISGTAANWTVTTTNLPVDPQGGSVVAWPGIGTATSVSGLSVVFPGSNLTSDTTLYCFNFAGASSTVGSAGDGQTGQLKTQGGSPYVNTVNYATSVVASNADQITVTASVSATMSFALSANSIALGTLSTSSVTSGNVTMTIGTNAPNGFVSWIEGTNTTGGSGLRSTVASSTITSPGSFDGTPSDLSATTGVVIDADAGTNTPTISNEYNGADANSGGYFDGGIFHQMANKTGAQTGTTVTINVRAKIPSTQPAATDYTDTLVVTAAGSF